MNLGVHKEQSVSAKIQDANMSVIEKHFHGEATQEISAALDTFTPYQTSHKGMKISESD